MQHGIVSFHTALHAGITAMDYENNDAIHRPAGMDAWILNYTREGSGRVNRGTDQFQTRVGDFLLFPPETAHDYGMHGAVGHWTHLWVYFTPKAAWDALLDWPPRTGSVRALHIESNHDRHETVRAFEALIGYARGTAPRRVELAMNLLERILLLCDSHNPRTGAGIADSRISRAMAFMAGNLTQPLSVADIAAHAALSESRLAHLFKSQTGRTPMQHLERLRINRAREMLIGTGRSIAEIAYQCGFGHPFYFTRVFKRHTGRPPRVFRRRARV